MGVRIVPLFLICIYHICKGFWQVPDIYKLSMYETMIGIISLRIRVSELEDVLCREHRAAKLFLAPAAQPPPGRVTTVLG